MNVRELGTQAREFILSETAYGRLEGRSVGEGVNLAEMIGTDASAARSCLRKSPTTSTPAVSVSPCPGLPGHLQQDDRANLPKTLTLAELGPVEAPFSSMLRR